MVLVILIILLVNSLISVCLRVTFGADVYMRHCICSLFAHSLSRITPVAFTGPICHPTLVVLVRDSHT